MNGPIPYEPPGTGNNGTGPRKCGQREKAIIRGDNWKLYGELRISRADYAAQLRALADEMEKGE